jgi:DegV family protein with EDD domain
MRPSGIHYLDGTRLKAAVIAGANHLISHRKHLDHINVFPVPDSDTGTNMAAAARYLVDSMRSVELRSVRHAADAVADAALFGGRGNSGAILAQFFLGFADGLEQSSRVLVHDFAAAAVRAAAAAREAVSEPQEGTILTVMTDWSNALTVAARGGGDYVRTLDIGHREAERSLARTPDLLPVLRQAHVVDAGGQGFLYLLDGVKLLIENGFATREAIVLDEVEEEIHTDELPDVITFRWCTEFMIEGDDLPRSEIREILEETGDSVVLAGSTKRMKVHLHTDDPGTVIDRLKSFGEVSREKADDMKQQWRHAHHPKVQRVAIMADTATDLPTDVLEDLNIHEIPFRIFFGDDQYIDKVTLVNTSFYTRLGTDPNHPKTTQPTQADFLRAYQLVAKHYDDVLSIHVPAGLSGTVQAARKIASSVSERIRVIDSNAGSVGMGLIVMEAAKAASEGRDADSVEQCVKSALKRTSTFVELPTTAYLLKGGRISRTKALVGRLLNVKIIFTVDSNGEILIVSRIVGGRDTRPEMLRLVERASGGKRPKRLAVSHAAAPEKADWYVDQFRKTYGDIDVLVGEFSPALGTHTGPGAVAVGILRAE